MAVNKLNPEKTALATHTWNPIQGCGYNCAYCFQRSMKKRFKQDDSIRLVEKMLDDKLGEGRTIFTCEATDLGGEWQKKEWILRVLEHCRKFDNTYILGTKNPGGLVKYIPYMAEKTILWVTVESNREELLEELSKAPKPQERYEGIANLFLNGIDAKLCLSMEPLVKFDIEVVEEKIEWLKPSILYLGLNSAVKQKKFDSRKATFEEPSREEINALYQIGLRVCERVITKPNLHDVIEI